MSVDHEPVMVVGANALAQQSFFTLPPDANPVDDRVLAAGGPGLVGPRVRDLAPSYAGPEPWQVLGINVPALRQLAHGRPGCRPPSVGDNEAVEWGEFA